MGVNTIKFSQFLTANLNDAGNTLVGIDSPTGGNNIKTALINSWTTSTRPSPPYNGLSGFNSSLLQWEYWNGTSWIQFSAGAGVSPGSINQLAWYAATGAMVSGLPTGNNGVLVTSNSGVPSISSILPSGLTIPGYALSGANSDITSMSGLTGYLQAPLGIKDPNGNIILDFGYVSNAVNFIRVINNPTGFPVVLVASGSDPSINMILFSKNGDFLLQDSTLTIAPTLKFFNAATTHFTGLKAATAEATDLTLVLPALDGSADAPMITDGSGNLSFLPGAWVDFSGSIGATGLTAAPAVVYALSKKIGKTSFINISLSGTSNATTFTITGLPYAAANGNFIGFHYAQDNSTNTICSGSISGTTLTLYFGTASVASGWTNAGTKGFSGYLFYETT